MRRQRTDMGILRTETYSPKGTGQRRSLQQATRNRVRWQVRGCQEVRVQVAQIANQRFPGYLYSIYIEFTMSTVVQRHGVAYILGPGRPAVQP